MLIVDSVKAKAGSTVTLTATDPEGRVMSGWNITAEIRHALTNEPLQILTTTLAGSTPTITISDEDTAALGSIDAVYELSVKDLDGAVFKSNTGRILLLPAVVIPGDEAAALPADDPRLLPSSKIKHGDSTVESELDQLRTDVDTIDVGGNDIVSWDEVVGKPATFTPAPHTHAIADVTGIQAALDAKSPVGHTHPEYAASTHAHDAASPAADGFMSSVDKAKLDGIEEGATAGGGDGSTDWTEITSKPATFPPAPHSHVEADIADLDKYTRSEVDAKLTSKADESHQHTLADVADAGTAALMDTPDTGNAAAGEVVLGSDTRLSDARTPIVHVHTKADLTDFSDSDYAAATHAHALADISDAGSAAAKSVPDAGDAATGEVVMGNDSRLTDARIPTAHSHSAAETSYDNTASGLEATDAKAAIDELAEKHESGGGGTSNVTSFVLAEALTAGDAVRIINDGGLAKAASVFEVIPEAQGTEEFATSSQSYEAHAAALDESHFVMAFGNHTSMLQIVVGTVTGTSITFGAPATTTFSQAIKVAVSATDASTFVIVQKENVCVGTLSGANITLGSVSAHYSPSGSIWDQYLHRVDSETVLLTWQDFNNIHARVGTVNASNRTVSWGSSYSIDGVTTSDSHLSTCQLTDTVFVAAFADGATQGTAIVLTADAAAQSVTKGSTYSFRSGEVNYVAAAATSANDVVIGYYSHSASQFQIVAGAVSGTSLSFGSPVLLASYAANMHAEGLGSGKARVFFTSRPVGPDELSYIDVTSDGSTVTVGPRIDVSTNQPQYIRSTSLGKGVVILAYASKDSSGSHNGAVAQFFQTEFTSDLRSDKTGIAQSTGGLGSSVDVALYGVSAAHSGLTPGQLYYVGDDGQPTATDTGHLLGRAISGTKILLS